MCGISGIYRPEGNTVSGEEIKKTLIPIRHRGPDEAGIYLGPGIGLGSVRLSILDIEHGKQPMTSSDRRFTLVYNGEIYNYRELQIELKSLGYNLFTNSDTEVLLLLFHHYGKDCLGRLNGQFAFSIWDRDKKELFLARDRMGIRPLYYYQSKGGFYFGSEMKCFLCNPEIEAEINLEALKQVFTFWTIPAPNTVFKDVYELPPGHFMQVNRSGKSIRSYWELNPKECREKIGTGSFTDRVEKLDELLRDAVSLRLRADVQVAAYLSGGLDSSATTRYIKQQEPGLLNTFSIGFEDAEFDESHFQNQVSEYLGTRHHAITCSREDIAANFAEVIWQTEIPLLRTAAVPMYMLSKLVRDHGIKVVVTGEGADEVFGGYNIFKEALIREFWSRQPDSRIRPMLFQRLYPYLDQFKGRSASVHRFFFGHQLNATDSLAYSHLVRWNNGRHLHSFFSNDVLNLQYGDPVEQIISSFPGYLKGVELLDRAQWIEFNHFLPGYLLSSQGDRVAMAHSVEGRYPFLDHRIVEFGFGLQAQERIRGLNEKFILKKLMDGRLPEEVIKRSKQAYRAPVASSLFGQKRSDYLSEMLSPRLIKEKGFFSIEKVDQLRNKLTRGMNITEMDSMALAAILSTQILHDMYIEGNRPDQQINIDFACPIQQA